MSEENVEVVRAALDAWNRAVARGSGGYDAAAAGIDPDIEAVVAYGVDFDGTYRGAPALAEMLGGFWAEFENIHLRIEETIPAGSHVVLAVRFSGRGKRSGVEIDMPAWQVWTLRDSKVVRWRIFRSKREALEAAGLSE